MFLAKLFWVVMVAGLLLVAPACTGLRPTRSGRRTGAPIRGGCAIITLISRNQNSYQSCLRNSRSNAANPGV